MQLKIRTIWFILAIVVLGCRKDKDDYVPTVTICCEDCCEHEPVVSSPEGESFITQLLLRDTISVSYNGVNYIRAFNFHSSLDTTQASCNKNPCDVNSVKYSKERYNAYQSVEVGNSVYLRCGILRISDTEQFYIGIYDLNPSVSPNYTYYSIPQAEQSLIGSKVINGNTFLDVYAFIHQGETYYFSKEYGVLQYFHSQFGWCYVNP